MKSRTLLLSDIDAASIASFHDACVAVSGWASSGAIRFTEGAWKYIELNHRFNSLLWAEEDQARRTDVGDDRIAANKRAIDKYNQQRQDAIEKIDELLLERLAGVQRADGARLHSETAGTMIDRMSILSLKIHHMGLQLLRKDVDAAHIEACRSKLGVLQQQRGDLQMCFDRLLAEAARGETYYKIYRQYKMYNDPNLNPYLYGAKQK